jgi:hypothetical protein
MFLELDLDSDGAIDFEEFLAAMISPWINNNLSKCLMSVYVKVLLWPHTTQLNSESQIRLIIDYDIDFLNSWIFIFELELFHKILKFRSKLIVSIFPQTNYFSNLLILI